MKDDNPPRRSSRIWRSPIANVAPAVLAVLAGVLLLAPATAAASIDPLENVRAAVGVDPAASAEHATTAPAPMPPVPTPVAPAGPSVTNVTAAPLGTLQQASGGAEHAAGAAGAPSAPVAGPTKAIIQQAGDAASGAIDHVGPAVSPPVKAVHELTGAAGQATGRASSPASPAANLVERATSTTTGATAGLTGSGQGAGPSGGASGGSSALARALGSVRRAVDHGVGPTRPLPAPQVGPPDRSASATSAGTVRALQVEVDGPLHRGDSTRAARRAQDAAATREASSALVTAGRGDGPRGPYASAASRTDFPRGTAELVAAGDTPEAPTGIAAGSQVDRPLAGRQGLSAIFTSDLSSLTWATGSGAALALHMASADPAARSASPRGSPPASELPTAPLPSPAPGGVSAAGGTGSGSAPPSELLLAGLLLLAVPCCMRRLRLVSELPSAVPFALINARPG